MAVGLPVLASRIKGHIDLLENTQNELLYDLGNEESLIEKILLLARNKFIGKKLGYRNMLFVKQYDLEVVRPTIINTYKEVL